MKAGCLTPAIRGRGRDKLVAQISNEILNIKIALY